ncbi:MAG: hypothetical protein HC904_08580, partial [Blastochloris sp.]|nr:hypothetical protein [Blastochloris sp.]
MDFNNTGGAQINQVAGSAANVISAPLSLTSGLTIANSSASNLGLNGVISGAGSLTVNSSGAGFVNLSAANTHSGGTTLTAGTLRLGNSAAVGTGTLILNGGTLSSDSGTARTISNAVSLGGNVGLAQASGGTGTMTFSGATTLTANSTITTNQTTTYSGTITDELAVFESWNRKKR